MISLLQALVDGVLNGGVYGVIAVGLSLVFGVLGIVNFSQAQFLMIGMYVAWFIWHATGIDPIIGAFAALVVGGAIGALLYSCLIRHVADASVLAQIFVTVGLIAVLENLALIFLGADYRSVKTSYQTEAINVASVLVSKPYLIAFTAAIIVSVLLSLLLNRSWLGRAIRATAQNEAASTAFGIDGLRTKSLAFGLGTGLTAFGGGVILPYASVNPTVGSQYIVLMFTVAVLGGLGSTMGALVGGIIVGIIQSVSTLFLPVQMKDLALFVVFIAILAIRPQGLLAGVSR